MHNVEQSTGFYSLPRYPSELCSNVPGYNTPPAHYGNINMAPYRQMTPPLDYQIPIQGGIQQQLPPTPRGTPPPFSPSQSRNEVVGDPRYQHCTSPRSRLIDNSLPSWSSYLDPAHRLQFQRTLGSGAYGIVHLAKDVSTQIHYAVKVLNKFLPNGLPLDLRQQQFQQTEMRLHYQVSAHPNIVSLLRIMDTPQNTYVIMEYCPEGDLFLNITERGRYVGDDNAAKKVFLQILDAVSHCHRLGIYHRDLKPENILVADDGHQVKLADFGLATTEPYATEFGCGSTFYMSPECQDQHSGKQYYACAPNDVWSLGVILVNLTCGRNPWKCASARDSTFRAYMEDRQFLKSILPLSDELNEILGMIFELDPSRRIKLDELRRRIIQCRHFTNTPQPIYLNTRYEGPLSPASSISNEGSMISDSSDNSDASTDPSEVDSIADCGLNTEIMDEDYDPELDDVFPYHGTDDTKSPASGWNDGSAVEDFQESSLDQYVDASDLETPGTNPSMMPRTPSPFEARHVQEPASQITKGSPQGINVTSKHGSEYPTFRSTSASTQLFEVGLNQVHLSTPQITPQARPKRSYRGRNLLGNPWPVPIYPYINHHFVFPVRS